MSLPCRETVSWSDRSDPQSRLVLAKPIETFSGKRPTGGEHLIYIAPSQARGSVRAWLNTLELRLSGTRDYANFRSSNGSRREAQVESMSKGKGSRNDQRSNSLNPNNRAHAASETNRAEQLNPTSPAYKSSRGEPKSDEESSDED